MDGQNFQNDQNNDQNNQTVDNSFNNSYYQDNTQYTQPVYTQPDYTQPIASAPAKAQTPTLAIVSLVMGILSIVLGCCYGIGIIFAIAGIIMAIIANKQQKSGIGTAGLICSIVGAVFSVVMLIYYIAVIGAVLSDPSLLGL